MSVSVAVYFFGAGCNPFDIETSLTWGACRAGGLLFYANGAVKALLDRLKLKTHPRLNDFLFSFPHGDL